MRKLVPIFTFLLLAAACEGGPGAAKEPPFLEVTSPARSLLQGQAGMILVTGTVGPGARGDAVEQVLVNGAPATVDADGSFRASIEIREGATLIHTVARDVAGAIASDTRAVHAGELRPVGTDVPSAITAALSADAFAKIGDAAGPLLKGLDLGAMLAPMQPMVHAGDPDGEDCAFARLFVDDITFTDVRIAMTPVRGGLAFTAELVGLEVPGRARYAVLCARFSNTLRITADRVVVAGTLTVTPGGGNGFTTRLTDPDVSLTNFRLDASGIPGDILGLLDLGSAIQGIVARGAELAMNPLMNQALGALAGPQQLDVLGTRLTMQVAPGAIAFSPVGAVVAMDLNVLLAGSEASPGFVFTDNGTPAMDAAHGLQLGIADDLANQLLAELRAIGALDLAMPVDGGTFDTVQVAMTLPPMISADASDGRLGLVLGDMLATFTRGGAPVARAAINARVELAIAPALNGHGVALQLGTPEIHVDPLDDIGNATGLPDDSLGRAVEASLGAQLASITKLLAVIPLPELAGLRLRDLSIGADAGYVMVRGRLD